MEPTTRRQLLYKRGHTASSVIIATIALTYVVPSLVKYVLYRVGEHYLSIHKRDMYSTKDYSLHARHWLYYDRCYRIEHRKAV